MLLVSFKNKYPKVLCKTIFSLQKAPTVVIKVILVLNLLVYHLSTLETGRRYFCGGYTRELWDSGVILFSLKPPPPRNGSKLGYK